MMAAQRHINLETFTKLFSSFDQYPLELETIKDTTDTPPWSHSTESFHCKLTFGFEKNYAVSYL